MNAASPPWRASTTAQYTSNAPAYISVQARRSLASNPQSTTDPHSTDIPPPKPAEAQGSKKRVEWPPGVRQYVQRSFVPEYQIPGITREDMEKKLKQIITEAAESNNLNNVNWEALPLPQEMIRDERNRALTSSTRQQPVGFHRSIPAYTERSQKEEYSPKRKSSEISTVEDNVESIPPWRRKANSRTEFEDRNSFPSPTDKRRRTDIGNDNANSKIPSKFTSVLESRKRRFEDTGSGSQATPSTRSPYEGSLTRDSDDGPVIGRCQNLEKNYFRLTAPPNPDTVRPLSVLKKTLDLLKKKWRSENNYNYVCDQFKSMRQDLTVQHIRNEFTVNVYEIHARIALEKGDLGEYNQCQTQLLALYAMNLGGHPMEFKAYRILYFIYTRNRTAINNALADLTPAEAADHAVKHALDVRSALALGNYHRFFQLYLDTPNMGAYLMDMFVDRERLNALTYICKAYKPDLNIRFITEELGFESDEQAARFILDHVPEELLQEKPDGVKLVTAKAQPYFEAAKAEAHRIVDIKGQI
ncbi:hypothetical protein D8B26_004725 [Coccidioides posadasii str. Silveira]|uniref:SAC3/GANP domain-containing protein n=3 Tax=Coccidioides posadasii TaxID=199306 RepID=E9D6T9_COCPS|nr:SAC3/GANP family protein [Coccidioides posadasii C735 delta SOWgp]EER28388.1 SAC3/GANP family protein [Coccidioides posadasii C735 delta SOWgp]EFW17961.1 SAC3/GANP domain-containing protein [Coccidioides posadasii str. Silveira]KMM68647.1 F01F1.1c [Coccidioides posadasii RMSCC 3488]QVM10062.1 hypothetical protein D8B26_004725 [Coccidioides posadasii str. Silveira]|eukprot:XP_003070533.1 SAC3/GANP family protein [Coccidioides posadasii C735 delta SOWgp]